jgi:NADH:ubiquinone oxidoreductase subunit F (NADH-binding)
LLAEHLSVACALCMARISYEARVRDHAGCPSTVTNVETVAVVPTILRRGADWFAGKGRKNNSGTKLFAIGGHVNNPCVVEEEMSISFYDLVSATKTAPSVAWQGVRPRRALLGLVRGGGETPRLPPTRSRDILSYRTLCLTGGCAPDQQALRWRAWWLGQPAGRDSGRCVGTAHPEGRVRPRAHGL